MKISPGITSNVAGNLVVKHILAKDDGLPMHSHGVDEAHFTIINSGTVTVIYGNGIRNTGTAGHLFFFPVGVNHSIIANDDDGAVISSITPGYYKNG
jgi:quercetin dioxygenase-like cupin family protein